MLLCAVIYTAFRSGLRHGLIGAMILILYNFTVVADRNDSALLSDLTLQRGAVVATAFLVVALFMGKLKDRNDNLLKREKDERKKAEESERRLRFMAESMPQKIFTVKPNGDSDYINPQWNEYTGTSDKAKRRNDWKQLAHPDDYSENVSLWRHSLATGEPFQFEHRIRRTDGKYLWHLTRARALRDEQGTIIAWIGSSTDIEDVRRTRKLEADTARLTKQRAELMELNTAKDEFISLASHQLRTPATGVKQYVNMVLDGYGGEISAEVRAYLEKVNESNERQLSVINDLLQVAQVDSGKVVLRKEKVNATELIAGIIHEQSSKFTKRKQTVVFDKRRTPLIVAADAIKLRMVVENIIDNASKYTPEGKKITVRLTRVRGTAKIAVIDEGVGILQKDTDKVFHKFVRLDNPLSAEVGGTGLGLYWVKKVIELHGGNIKVSSKINKGSTFTVSLPLSEDGK